jgi:Ca2+/Na+ antiporter
MNDFKSIVFNLQKRHIRFICSFILFYLLFVGLFLASEGLIVIDTKIVAISIIFCISFSDLKEINEKDKNHSRLKTHLIFSTISLVLCLLFTHEGALDFLILKISFILINIMYYHLIYARYKLDRRNEKAKLKKDGAKTKIKDDLLITIEEIRKEEKASMIRRIKQHTESYEKMFFTPD